MLIKKNEVQEFLNENCILKKEYNSFEMQGKIVQLIKEDFNNEKIIQQSYVREGSCFASLNKKMRESNLEGLNEEEKTIYDALKNEIEKYVLKEKTIVFRSISVPSDSKLVNLKKNDIFELKGFLSTSLSFEVANNFGFPTLANDFKILFIFELENYKCFPVFLKDWTDEQELILNAGSFIVKNIQKNKKSPYMPGTLLILASPLN